MQTRLIAETGDSGEVVWVWVSNGTDRVARPLTPRRAASLHVDEAQVSGANRDAVKRWLRERLGDNEAARP